jgi:transcriptional regulator with XRE-family HTH domain
VQTPSERTRYPAYRLAERRRALRLTQKALAEKAFVGRGTIRDLEQGRRAVSLELLMRCAVVLDCPLDELIEPEWWNFRGDPVKPVRRPRSPETRCPSCRGRVIWSRSEDEDDKATCRTCSTVIVVKPRARLGSSARSDKRAA